MQLVAPPLVTGGGQGGRMRRWPLSSISYLRRKKNRRSQQNISDLRSRIRETNRKNKITSWRRGGHHAGLFVLCRTEGSRASRAERGGRTERRPEGSHRRARTEVGSRLAGSGAAQRREGGRCWPVPVRCVKVTHRVRMMGCSCGLG